MNIVKSQFASRKKRIFYYRSWRWLSMELGGLDLWVMGPDAVYFERKEDALAFIELTREEFECAKWVMETSTAFGINSGRVKGGRYRRYKNICMITRWKTNQ